ncbi:MAG: MBL fold metallo-hydrolase [Phycisphaeraceae bacterium]|nr:MAG: MBL fold metallo-hydrolase [Phycisphaeraceae bacterium]
MRLRFLGTGTSAGVPAIGCSCAVCTSADPRDQRLRTSASLEFTDASGHDRVVLIDAGPDLRQQALRAGLTRCDSILFTHNHVDHTFGLDEVRRFNAVQRAPVMIHAEDHTLAFLRRVFEHIFDPRKNINDSFVATLIPSRLTPGVAFELHGLTVTPFRLLHGRLPVLGFRFDAPGAPPAGFLPLAYCTDVSGVPPESWAYLDGLSTLVLDALRHRHHPTHLTLGQAVSIATNAGAARTYFVHMAHDLPHAETDASLPEGMSLAYDGLVLE